MLRLFFFLAAAAPTAIYTLSLHDALPILSGLHNAWTRAGDYHPTFGCDLPRKLYGVEVLLLDRKSTRLNSSHSQISYAVFCLKKKTRASPPFRTGRRSPDLMSLCAGPVSH